MARQEQSGASEPLAQDPKSRARGTSKHTKRYAMRNVVCQVKDCSVEVGSKAYHKRYCICTYHCNLPSLVLDGQSVRWCQQCGRFQPLVDFDGDKKTCRARLDRHNQRRRGKSKFAAVGKSPPKHAANSTPGGNDLRDCQSSGKASSGGTTISQGRQQQQQSPATSKSVAAWGGAAAEAGARSSLAEGRASSHSATGQWRVSASSSAAAQAGPASGEASPQQQWGSHTEKSSMGLHLAPPPLTQLQSGNTQSGNTQSGNPFALLPIADSHQVGPLEPSLSLAPSALGALHGLMAPAPAPLDARHDPLNEEDVADIVQWLYRDEGNTWWAGPSSGGPGAALRLAHADHAAPNGLALGPDALEPACASPDPWLELLGLQGRGVEPGREVLHPLPWPGDAPATGALLPAATAPATIPVAPPAQQQHGQQALPGKTRKSIRLEPSAWQRAAADRPQQQQRQEPALQRVLSQGVGPVFPLPQSQQQQRQQDWLVPPGPNPNGTATPAAQYHLLSVQQQQIMTNGQQQQQQQQERAPSGQQQEFVLYGRQEQQQRSVPKEQQQQLVPDVQRHDFASYGRQVQQQQQQQQQQDLPWQQAMLQEPAAGMFAPVLAAATPQLQLAPCPVAAAAPPAPAGLPRQEFELQHLDYLEGQLVRVSIKLFDVTPDKLAPHVREGVVRLVASEPAFVDSFVRPGCTHITVSALLAEEERRRLLQGGAEELARRVLEFGAQEGPMGASWSSNMLVQLERDVAVVRQGKLVSCVNVAHSAPRLILAFPPALLVAPRPAEAAALAATPQASMGSGEDTDLEDEGWGDAHAQNRQNGSVDSMHSSAPVLDPGSAGVITLFGRGIGGSHDMVVCRQQGRVLDLELLGRGVVPLKREGPRGTRPNAGPPVEWVAVRPLRVGVGLLEFEVQRGGMLSQALPVVGLPTAGATWEARLVQRLLAGSPVCTPFLQRLGLALQLHNSSPADTAARLASQLLPLAQEQGWQELGRVLQAAGGALAAAAPEGQQQQQEQALAQQEQQLPQQREQVPAPQQAAAQAGMELQPAAASPSQGAPSAAAPACNRQRGRAQGAELSEEQASQGLLGRQGAEELPKCPVSGRAEEEGEGAACKPPHPPPANNSGRDAAPQGKAAGKVGPSCQAGQCPTDPEGPSNGEDGEWDGLLSEGELHSGVVGGTGGRVCAGYGLGVNLCVGALLVLAAAALAVRTAVGM